jgi:nitrogen fixation-related uncharacterized protein
LGYDRAAVHHPALRAQRRSIMGFFETLPDGWTIYVWLFAGAAIIIAAAVWMRWGFKNEQFDEDIKYVVFNEDDRDKMTPEDYAKSREVMKAQLASRERHLALQAAQQAAEKGG